MCHLRGEGVGVEVGHTESGAPNIAPETGGAALPSVRGLFEQPKASAAITMAKNIASREIERSVRSHAIGA
jgi:hypothetical protein